MTDINFVRVGAATSFVGRTVSSSGLLTVELQTPSGAMIECEDGVSITGVKITENGTDATGYQQFHEAVVMLRGKPGATATLVHDDTNEAAAHRIRCSTGADMALAPDRFVLLVYRKAEDRWVAHSMQGADGATGAQGPAGPQGEPGPNNVTTYSGVTAGAGTYSVVFSQPYTNVPNVQQSLIGGTSNQYAEVTSRSETGFTITTYTRNIVNLVDAPIETNGLTVDVVVTSND